jgi:transformer-2 protein
MTVSPFGLLVLYCRVLILNFSGERFYDPRPYDSRYARDYDNEDRRGGRGRYEERPPRDFDRGYRDFDRGPRDYDRAYGREPREYDRRHDDKRY